MPKGPAGAPRPFSEYRVVVDTHENTVDLKKVGPLGGPRPLAKDNPPIDDERIAECMMSEAGIKFGAGVVSDGATKDMGDLSPQGRQEALDMTEKWCRGLLEAAAIESLEEDEAIPALSQIRVTLADMTGRQDNITIDLEDIDDPTEAQERIFELMDVDNA